MPFPNEHAVRLVDPGEFERFRRVNDELGPGIHVIYGIREDRTSAIQALRFSLGKFTETQVRAWLKEHDMKPIGFEAATGPTKKAFGYLSLKVPKEYAETLAIEPDNDNSLNPEDMHVTLGVFDTTYLDHTSLVKAVADLANEANPVSIRLQGTARFHNPDEHAFVLLADSSELYTLRNKCADRLTPFDDLHGYNPHITVKYLGVEADDPAYEYKAAIITLTEMILEMDGGHKYVFPMVGGQQTPPALHPTKGANLCKACAYHRIREKAEFEEDYCGAYSYYLESGDMVCDDFEIKAPDQIEFYVAAIPPDVEVKANGVWNPNEAVTRLAESKLELPDGAWMVTQGEQQYGLICDVDDDQIVIRPEAVKALFEEEWPDWISETAITDAKKFAAVCAAKVIGDPPMGKSLDLDDFDVAGRMVATTVDGNCLKALEETDTEIIVGNYLALWGGRDLEGIVTKRVNDDGSIGEFFLRETDFESIFTQKGFVPVDWEHRRDAKGVAAPKDEVMGHVDWESAQKDAMGLWVRRVLDRRNKYIDMLYRLGWFQKGMLGTSSEPIQAEVVKAKDGALLRWPLRGDTMTVVPMEPRMMAGNELELMKSLGIPLPLDKGVKNKVEAAILRLQIKLKL